jgi:hypothetical protein
MVDEEYLNACREEFRRLAEERSKCEEEARELMGVMQAVKQLAINEKWDIAPGTIIRRKKDGKIFKVKRADIFARSLEECIRSPPWVIASPQKKDGKFSSVEQGLSHDEWELVT